MYIYIVPQGQNGESNQGLHYATTVQSPVIQSVVSLPSSLVVKMLTVLVSTVSISQAFLLKNVSSFCICKSYSHFFQQKY